MLTGDGKSTEADSKDERSDGKGGVVRAADEDEKEGLHAKATAVEDLSHVRRRHTAWAAQVVSQVSANGHHKGHAQVGQCTEDTRLKC